jgi:uncharacterized membrane protein
MISRFRTFIAGFLVALPLAVTITVIVWVGTFIYAYVGPDSAIGRILISIGFNFSSSPAAAYALSAVVVIGLVYLLGLLVESRLETRVRQLIDSAPVPVGGCLVYVPVQWVKPAEFGVEALMSIYVSMGVVSPQTVGPAPVMSGDCASRVDKSVA